jgi:hypothetical protein
MSLSNGSLPTASRRLLTIVAVLGACGLGASTVVGPSAQGAGWEAQDRAIAMQFAPVFHQGLVGTGRFDYITNIDFDGDWVGDNNWKNAGDAKHPLKGHVYYAVSETPTHYFIHYAAFHPRDYKGGEVTGAILSQAVRRGARASKRVTSTPIADEVVLAHENDLEGCLVVVAKRGENPADGRVVLVETLAHNQYLKYQPEGAGSSRSGSGADGVGAVQLEGQHPLIYIEPKGHGMQAFADQLEAAAAAAAGRAASSAAPPATTGAGSSGGSGGGGTSPPRSGLVQRIGGMVAGVNQARRAVNNEGAERIRVYRFTGTSDDPDVVTGDVGYELVSTYHTLWAKAREGGEGIFGDVRDYGSVSIPVVSLPVASVASPAAGSEPSATPVVKEVRLGRLGASLRGVEGAINMARPPWGWFDASDRNRPVGEWFLDPAGTVVRHVDALRAVVVPAYLHQPFLSVFRPATP